MLGKYCKVETGKKGGEHYGSISVKEGVLDIEKGVEREAPW
jgi:hypothetical protein